MTAKIKTQGNLPNPILPIVTTNNRLNTSGSPVSGVGGTSFYIYDTVAPGQTTCYAVSGTSFYVFSSNGTLSIQPSGGYFVEYTQGTGLMKKDGNTLTQLNVQNTGATAVTFILFVGFDEFIDRRVVLVNGPLTAAVPVQNAATKNKGTGKTTIAGGSTDTYAGTANGSAARKSITVTNNDGAQTLQVFDSTNTLFATIQPAMAWFMESSDVWKVHNANGGAVAYNVGEVYYAS